MTARTPATRAALSALVAASAACAAACADPGEVLLVVQTDLAVPKDIDAITLEVEAGGAILFSSRFPPAQDELELPGTLDVVSRDPDQLITARAVGWRGDTPRILREAVTRAPEDRVLMLRLPLHWLCDGSAGPAEAPAAGACPAGSAGDPASARTCVLGACAPAYVDPEALPEYAAEDVFGGGSGSGSDGRCFDVTACFADAAEAELDLATCSIEAAGAANVALLTEGDGICGPSGCFVALDAPGASGFPAEGGRVQLPRAVCERRAEGELLGVVTSTGCPPKTEREPVCGPWSLAGGASPDPAGPVTVAAGQHRPAGIALRGDHVYWTAAGLSDADGRVRRAPRGGGTPEDLATGQARPSGVAVHEAEGGAAPWVTWINDGAGAVMRAPAAGGGAGPTALTQYAGTRSGLVIQGGSIAWTTSTGLVLSLPEGGGAQPLTLASSQPDPAGITAAGAGLLWINRGDGTLVQRAGGVIVMLADGEGTPGAVAADATHAYWTTSTGGGGASGKVLRASLGQSAGAIEEIASGQAFPYAIAVDATRVYWTNLGDGTVMRAAKERGARPEVVASGQPNPVALAVDDRHVIWANAGTSGRGYADGSIMRAAR